MENTLGRVWSAWQGAINILQTPRTNGYVHGSLLRAIEIESFGEKEQDRISSLLARVTHHTNIPRSRNRIRPEGVMQLALKRRLTNRSHGTIKNTFELESENAALWNELENLEQNYIKLEEERDSTEMRAMELEDKNQELKDALRNLQYKTNALNKISPASETTVDTNFLIELASQTNNPTPFECLKAIEIAFPNKCEILDSAWESARNMDSFQNGKRLLNLLRKLMAEYAIEIENGGDSRARMVFSSEEYSANESETVENSPSFRSKRIFNYKEKPVEMFKHLKIGKADNISHTLRVHFAWIPDEKKILIGHCGEHLPVPSH
jgi:hypothetical protein